MATFFPTILLIVLIVTGMPVAFALALSGAIGIFLVTGFDAMYGIVQTTPYRSTASVLLSTIPLFIAMAEFLARGSIVRDLYRLFYLWLAGFRGGLALAAIAANVGFAALSGSSTAAAAAMARISMPEMRRYGYDPGLSLAVVSISGTLSILIPPSVGLIIYGVLTETSIGELFVAGIIPGLLTASVYVVTVLVVVTRKPELAPEAELPDRSERFRAILPVWPVLLLCFLVLGTLYTGIVTATEAAAVGAVGGLVLSVLVGGLRWNGFTAALRDTTRTTAMIFAIIIGAMIFGYYLSIAQIPSDLVNWVASLGLSRTVVLIAIIAIYIFLGFFLDLVAIIVLTIPVTFPLVMSLGYNPVWFGIIVAKTVEIGLVTPPMGINIFVASGVSGVPPEKGFVGIIPFLVGEFLLLAALVALPELSLLFVGS